MRDPRRCGRQASPNQQNRESPRIINRPTLILQSPFVRFGFNYFSVDCTRANFESEIFRKRFLGLARGGCVRWFRSLPAEWSDRVSITS
jgi:hypothetical protein